MSRTFTRQLLFGAAISVASVVALPATAWAHIEAESSTTDDGLTKVHFSFTHGCGESPTNALRIQLPPGTTDVEPEDKEGWTSKVTDTELGWNGGPATNGTKITFEATMKLTGKEGDTVFFPTIQACVAGENTWIDKSQDPEADQAAPRIELGAEATGGEDHHKETTTTAQGGEDHDKAGTTTTAQGGQDHDKVGTTAKPTTATAKSTGATAAAAGTTAKAVATDPASSTSGSSNTPLIIGGVVLLVILAAGGFALSKRGSSAT